MEPDSTTISLDRGVCTDLQAAARREWLVTNGLGGYAMGTVSGMRTRGYHGLLVAALDPPLGRTLLLSSLEETLTHGGKPQPLFTNAWQGGALAPEGYKNLAGFRLDGTMPVWEFAVGGARLEKRVWMPHGENTTYVRYTLLSGDTATLDIKVLVNYRDHHGRSHDTGAPLQAEAAANGLCVTTPGGTPFFVLSRTASMQPQHTWYENLWLSTENERGLDATDNNLLAGIFHAELRAGESLDIVASTDEHASLDGAKALRERQRYEHGLLARSPLAGRPTNLRALVLAASQFVVQRGQGNTVIAGYPWFGDWGRDTFISLPGLTLATGRPETAADILRTFAAYIDQGMLPNRFPDSGQQPEYNTVDATLWYFQAVHAYYQATKDKQLLRDLFPALQGIVRWHIKGTRHNIHIDPADSLLYAGEPGTQLTWMDAKYDDQVVTPRIGKPVEVNALWYNALNTMADFAAELGETAAAKQYDTQAHRVRVSFDRFWNQQLGCCYDVLDGPEGAEAHVRPNQLLAVSLPHSPLSRERQKAIVNICENLLLTPYGLRSLAPDDAAYLGTYTGATQQRDGAYHQGTVWAWLLGPFVEAHYRVYRDKARAYAYLAPLLEQHLADYGLGSVSEVLDGNRPFTARGCPWQAWSVAELLRVCQLA